MYNTNEYMYKTKYAVLHRSRTYTKAYIDIERTCMYKGHFKGTFFVKAWVAQSVQHQATNLKVVGLSSTMGKNISFCVFSLSVRSWQVNWSHTNEIKHDIHSKQNRESIKGYSR